MLSESLAQATQVTSCQLKISFPVPAIVLVSTRGNTNTNLPQFFVHAHRVTCQLSIKIYFFVGRAWYKILKQILLKNKTETAVIRVGSLPFTDIYRNVSEKSCWKVNETRFWAQFQLKISGSNGTSENVVLISRSECFKREFIFHFFKLIPISGFCGCHFRQMELFCAVWTRFRVNYINQPVL